MRGGLCTPSLVSLPVSLFLSLNPLLPLSVLAAWLYLCKRGRLVVDVCEVGFATVALVNHDGILIIQVIAHFIRQGAWLVSATVAS